MELDIEKIIDELIEDVKSINPDNHLNERYLHHLFSHKVQNRGYSVSFSDREGLHPEWATYIKGVRNGGRYFYNKPQKQYQVCSGERGAGFIDFAIGNSENPDYAIEFKMSKQFNTEGAIFDFIKLLDKRNKIAKKSIAFSVYYGHKTHSGLLEKEILKKYCLLGAVKRLKGNYDNKRLFHFVFIEITSKNEFKIVEINNNDIKYSNI